MVLQYTGPDILFLSVISLFVLKYAFFRDKQSEGLAWMSFGVLLMLINVVYGYFSFSEEYSFLFISAVHPILFVGTLVLLIIGFAKFLFECLK